MESDSRGDILYFLDEVLPKYKDPNYSKYSEEEDFDEDEDSGDINFSNNYPY